MILTANQRLARTLRKSHDAEQVAAGRAAWESPVILPFSTWLRERWSDAVLAGALPPLRLLSAAQQETVWRRIIERSGEGASILDLRGTAASAIEAWRLVQQYRLPLDHRFDAHEDWSAFHGWAGEYSALCEQNGWTDDARIPDAVRDAIDARSVDLPARLTLAGFDEFTPQQKQVVEALEQAGCVCDIAAPESTESTVVKCGCADRDDELRSAAMWAARHHVGAASIGIVLLSAGASRTRLERIFDEALHPERLSDPASGGPRVFHISMGDPLSSYPLVDAALLVLHLAGLDRWPMAGAGRLLRSGYLRGGVEEAPARAMLDARLRRWRRAYLRPDAIRALCTTSACPLLAHIFDQLQAVSAELTPARPPSEWPAIFRALLEAAGWPGDRVLSSAEYQVSEAWSGLLRAFSSLDPESEKMTYDSAVARLAELAANTQFQPQDTGARVQIMGPLEAAGAKFDRLWICGADDSTWPAPAHPHPFLPLGLQRDRKLPHSSPERELEFAERTFARLRASAPTIVVSWPREAGDVELRASPLLDGLKDSAEPARSRLRAVIPTEQLIDETGPPLETTAPRGGTRIIRSQSACPFRAFADFRLGARPMDSAELGLSPADRGIAVHKALELFWLAVHDHAALIALTPGQLQDTARQAAAAAVQAVMRDSNHEFDRRFRDLEIARLTGVLVDWAGVEQERAPFQVVFSERERTIAIAGLELSARMDRVDQLADGSQVILDYKTTAPSPGAWAGERPDEPQVPLYALSNDADVAAVAFAQLGSAGLRFRGLAAEDGLIPGMKASPLAEQIEEWRRVLEPIAGEFRDGVASADPKRGATTCKECGLAALCRIHEVSVELADEE